jgi:hypothetical protein
VLASAHTPEQFHDFFAASASVAGALIGLLFVAISVTPHRVTGERTDLAHSIRASAALTAFSNALTISLFALIPTDDIGYTATVVGALGLLFVAGSLMSVLRVRHRTEVALRDVSFLVGLLVLFAAETDTGARLIGNDRAEVVGTLAVITVVCFLVGIARSWELIGASSFGLFHETFALWRKAHEPAADDEPEAP